MAGLSAADMVDKLRKTFASGRTKDLKWRRDQLKAMRLMMVENKDAFVDVLYKDLHKGHMETILMEWGLVCEDIDFALEKLNSWAAPKKVQTDVFNLPAKSMIVPEPYGVALIVGCWNYPIVLTIQPMIAAIAAGNTMLVKSGSEDCSPEFAKLCEQLFPKYLDNDACMYVRGGLDRLQELLVEKFDVMFATGSAGLGRMMAAAAAPHLTPVVLELGGKSPGYVSKTTNIDVAAWRITWAAFVNAGQTCVRPDYIMVDSEVADSFIAAVTRATREFYGADPQTSEDFGRIASDPSFKRVAAMVSADRKYVLWGGETDESQRYVAPTLLDFGTDSEAFHNSASMSAEIFGPLMPLLRVSSVDQVIASILTRDKPLAAYVFTTDTKVQARFINETSSGALLFNECLTHLNNNHLPFGGVGGSGMGSYHGKFGFNTFSHAKPVMIRSTAMDIWARYPPYTEGKKKFLAMVMRHLPGSVMTALNTLTNPIVWATALFTGAGAVAYNKTR